MRPEKTSLFEELYREFIEEAFKPENENLLQEEQNRLKEMFPH